MSDSRDSTDLLEFPCHYQFKAIGVAGEDFRREIMQAVAQHAHLPEDAVRWQMSRNQNYQSLSLMVTLHSYTQLTEIYAGMKAVAGVKMLL